jgi:hypothetical protein
MITRFVSHEPRTPFAPGWDYPIYEDNILSEIDQELICRTILKNEMKVINSYDFTDDWGTQLGENSMTSRSDSYNLLKWPEMASLIPAIKKSYNDFLTGLDSTPEKNIYVACWANVLRKGEQVKIHHHWDGPYVYLGGHICIQQENTNTNYVNPFTRQAYFSENVPGKITLFPNWLEHYSDQHNGSKERITIAFDLINEKVYNEDIREDKKTHWLKI